MAARKLGVSNVAIVIGKTIYLHNTSKQDLFKNTGWLRHEVAHLKQFREHGVIVFIIRYVWESLKNGYADNKYESAARKAENDEDICDDVTFEEERWRVKGEEWKVKRVKSEKSKRES